MNMFGKFLGSVYKTPIKVFSTKNSSKILDGLVVSENDVRKVICQGKVFHNPGPDGIPHVLLKKFICQLKSHLTFLFNRSLVTGMMPEIWKEAFVTPIFKDGDRANIANYRPVSIIPAMAKALDKLVYIALHRALSHKISPHQHGFMGRRSGESNLWVHLDELVREIEERGQVDTVYLDFAKTFDSVEHYILLSVLWEFGIRGKLFAWLFCYLRNRLFKVKIRDWKSRRIIMTSGVPQGSCLGPLLFLLFINSFLLCIKNSSILFFADDAKVKKSITDASDCERLQEDLERVRIWCIKNNLDLNEKKCLIMPFTRNNRYIAHNYVLSNTIFKRSELVKDLGVFFDSKLHLS